jgi:hypothetical protein
VAVKRVIALAVLGLVACVKEAPTQPVACQNPVAGCVVTSEISVKFSSQPAVMHKFSLDVQAPQIADLHASFQMQGMDMGPNRYRLLWDGKQWHADVMLPACVRGRHDWLLRLETRDRVYEIPFVSQ